MKRRSYSTLYIRYNGFVTKVYRKMLQKYEIQKNGKRPPKQPFQTEESLPAYSRFSTSTASIKTAATTRVILAKR